MSQQLADGLIVALNAVVAGFVEGRLNVKHGVACVEVEVGDGDEIGVDALGLRKFYADGEEE